MIIQRNDWKISKSFLPIDLSKNVHYDKVLHQTCKTLLKDIDQLNNYPNEFLLYESISQHHNIPTNQLTIGYGATDLIQRIVCNLEYDRLIIVSPTFEMVEIYCQLHNINYLKVDIESLEKHYNNNDAVYIANPNGLTGKTIDVTFMTDKFKYVILDEVYIEFNPTYSLINKNISNVIVIRSFSKSLGLAGLRVGFSVATEEITAIIQMFRMNYITNSIACYLIPKIIHLTPEVILRMKKSKSFLESNFDCVPSSANFVLFKQPNKYTDIFGYRLVSDLYRMALADMDTLNEGR